MLHCGCHQDIQNTHSNVAERSLTGLIFLRESKNLPARNGQ